MEFFVTSTRNLLAAETTVGVVHHVALSVVGVDRVKDSGYFRAKAAQEDIIRASSIPYTIVRSTQFFDFMDRILQLGMDGDVIRVPPALIQPVAPDDVAEALAEIAVSLPLEPDGWATRALKRSASMNLLNSSAHMKIRAA